MFLTRKRSLWPESVFVGDVSDADLLALGVGVGVASVHFHRFVFGARILQFAIFLPSDAIAGLEVEIVAVHADVIVGVLHDGGVGVGVVRLLGPGDDEGDQWQKYDELKRHIFY